MNSSRSGLLASRARAARVACALRLSGGSLRGGRLCRGVGLGGACDGALRAAARGSGLGRVHCGGVGGSSEGSVPLGRAYAAVGGRRGAAAFAERAGVARRSSRRGVGA